MTIARVLRYYRRWLLLSSMALMSGLVILNTMLNQLAMEGDGTLSDVFQPPADTHIRSIRNYEQKPREKFKILQILQPGREYVKDKLSVHHNNADRLLPRSQSDLEKNLLDSERGDRNKNIDEDEDDDYNDKDDDYNNVSDNDNPDFKAGDFPGVVDFQKPPFQYEEISKTGPQKEVAEPSLENQQSHSHAHIRPDTTAGSSQHRNPLKSVKGPYTQGVYWTDSAEQTVPKGKSNSELTSLLKYIRRQSVKRLLPPEWNRCGRPLNGIVYLKDGSSMCARYRGANSKFILGEVMSFSLSRLLGMDNVPPVVLSWVSPEAPQWAGINYTSLKWQDNQIVALIDWVPDINLQGSQVFIPPLLHKALRNMSVVTPHILASQHLLPRELSQLIQWGDMIIFDYLTGNYDRYASMQDAAEKDGKPSILLEHVRNLKKSTKTGKLWLIDNESGLFDAYDLLYMDRKPRFIHFHRQMLQTMCLFRRDLVERLESLMSTKRPDMVLYEYARHEEALLESIPLDTSDPGNTYSLFHNKFADRLQEVLQWVQQCKSHL
ncbi:four-jointed box protein 1-like [Liolophura sinensis]|uniref:four-jointed box protein 1-like n=1 Tax=Liolophura sinensis TaxID=3198878 RepID=UPI00315835C2